jgi:hypothetical protein
MQLLLLLLACGEKEIETGLNDDTVLPETEESEEEEEEQEEEEEEEEEEETDTSTDEPTQETIENIQQGLVATGEMVTLENVIVSSPSNYYGFYITSATGGAYSGMFVYYYFDDAITLSVEQGDILTITGEVWEYPDTCEDRQDNDDDGLVDEEDPDCLDGGQEIELDNYQTMTELKLLDPGDINKTGETSTDPSVTIVDSSLLASPETAEAYEGVLVRVENGVVTSELNDDGEWGLDNVMVDDLFDVRPGLVNDGDSFDTVQGILHFSSGSFKIVPRSQSDLVGWNRTCMGEKCIWNATEGELFISEFMANPNDDGNCPDSQGEYVEVVYSSSSTSTLDLRGLQLSDESKSESITNHIVLEPGSSAWISVGDVSCYGNADTQLGSTSFSLNNGGDTLSLFHDDVDGQQISFDQLIYNSDWVENGVSIQLSSDKMSSVDNDDLNNWCFSTTEIGMTLDLGSPGQSNEVCSVLE